MDKLPCIDCITLAMCKQLINPYSLTVSKLANKCEIFNEYVRKDLIETGLSYIISARGKKDTDTIPLDLLGLEHSAKKVKKTVTEVLEFFNMNFYVKDVYILARYNSAFTVLFGEKNESK